jgi:uncharacterized protein YjiS (DUF1127 family)
MELKMRDYILSQAQSRQTHGLVATAKRVVRNWKHQRELKKLSKLDDYLLKDLGLTRGLVQHLLALPLTVDVDWEQERVLRVVSLQLTQKWKRFSANTEL